MDEQDKYFLLETMRHRMEVHYHKMSEAKPHSIRKEELDTFIRKEKEYQKVLETLNEADREIIKTYVDDVGDRAVNETENYYRCGFQDGLHLMGSLIRYYIR